MAKRIIGLFLALCLVVGLLPMMAMAEDTVEKKSSVTIYAGTNTDQDKWAPTMAEGMTPIYRKTTAEGRIVTGATAEDYNLKVEWPAGGNPSLTLKDATITNNNAYISGIGATKYNTITIGGNTDFRLVLKGTNTIYGVPVNTSTTTAAYRCPFGIYATTTGTLTITGESQADSLLIQNRGGHSIDRRYGALVIENISLSTKNSNTGDYQHGILMQYESSSYADKTNLTIRNAKLDMNMGPSTNHCGIVLTSSNDKIGSNSDRTAVESNTSDILIQDSDVSIYRKGNSSSSALVRMSPQASR